MITPKKVHKPLQISQQRLNIVKKDNRDELQPILTPEQLIGFLKDKAPIAFEREKTDRLLP